MANLVTQVGHLIASGVPNRLFAIDAVKGAIRFVIELHIVEDEELGLRPEEGRVRDSGAGQVLLSA